MFLAISLKTSTQIALVFVTIVLFLCSALFWHPTQSFGTHYVAEKSIFLESLPIFTQKWEFNWLKTVSWGV